MAFAGNADRRADQAPRRPHRVRASPLGLTAREVPADLVAKEREIAVEQAKATGKPQQIAEKIAEGKLNAFFAERVLLDQEFFNAQVFKGTIAELPEAERRDAGEVRPHRSRGVTSHHFSKT